MSSRHGLMADDLLELLHRDIAVLRRQRRQLDSLRDRLGRAETPKVCEVMPADVVGNAPDLLRPLLGSGAGLI